MHRRKALPVPQGLETKATGLHQCTSGPATFMSAGVSLWKLHIKLMEKKNNLLLEMERKPVHAIALKIQVSLGWGGLHFNPTQIIKLRILEWALRFWIIIIIMTGFSSQDSVSL